MAQDLIGLMEYLYEQGAYYFLESHLDRTPMLSIVVCVSLWGQPTDPKDLRGVSSSIPGWLGCHKQPKNSTPRRSRDH